MTSLGGVGNRNLWSHVATSWAVTMLRLNSLIGFLIRTLDRFPAAFPCSCTRLMLMQPPCIIILVWDVARAESLYYSPAPFICVQSPLPCALSCQLLRPVRGGRPSLPLSACVEWPVTAAPLCRGPQCSLTPPSTFLIAGRHGYHSDALMGRLCSEDLLLLRSHMRCPVTHFSSKGCCFSGRHAGVGSARCGSADAGKTIVVLFVVVCAPALPSHSLIFFCFVHLWLVEFGGCFTQVLD